MTKEDFILIEVKKAIYFFYYDLDMGGGKPHQLQNISDIKIEETDEQIQIIIYAHYPGIIIGLHGKDYDRLVEWLKRQLNMFNKEIYIVLKDDEFWKFEYHLNINDINE